MFRNSFIITGVAVQHVLCSPISVSVSPLVSLTTTAQYSITVSGRRPGESFEAPQKSSSGNPAIGGEGGRVVEACSTDPITDTAWKAVGAAVPHGSSGSGEWSRSLEGKLILQCQ